MFIGFPNAIREGVVGQLLGSAILTGLFATLQIFN
jgi:hypothetical protein